MSDSKSARISVHVVYFGLKFIQQDFSVHDYVGEIAVTGDEVTEKETWKAFITDIKADMDDLNKGCFGAKDKNADYFDDWVLNGTFKKSDRPITHFTTFTQPELTFQP